MLPRLYVFTSKCCVFIPVILECVRTYMTAWCCEEVVVSMLGWRWALFRIIPLHTTLLPSGTRCYSNGHVTPEKAGETAVNELEPLRLPGKLAAFTGNVLYPNEDSAVWDVDGKKMVGELIH